MSKVTKYVRAPGRAAALALAAMPFGQAAFAQSTISTALNNIIGLLNGTTLLAAATLAIMVVGFLWMTGRMELMRAVTIVIGIGIVGAAASIAATLTT